MSRKAWYILLGGIFLLFSIVFAIKLGKNRTPPGVVLSDAATPVQTVISPTPGETKVLPDVPDTLILERVFAEDHSWTNTLPSSHLRTIIATGDVIPARSVNTQVLRHNDYTWPYLSVAAELKKGDLRVINLETPLITPCVSTDSGMSFCGDSRNVEGIVYAGVDAANFANNHMANYGELGVKSTEKLLIDHNIAVFGLGKPVIKDIRGIRFAFLGYNDIGNYPFVASAASDFISRDIRSVRSQADVVLVAFHWGIEYQSTPSARQRELGHLAIDSGADVVLGNHPHWIEPVELYKGKFITYAHGNFVFDQMWSEETTLGVVGRYTFYDTRLIDVEFLPVKIHDYGQPVFLSGAAKQSVIRSMQTASAVLRNVQSE
jgi:poly-gamma-glutamate capsule biosynthesis protein CapA/YwtB (metallophosphatase superfamily)